MITAQSITAKIINISRRQGVPFDRIMISFLLERAVARLVYQKDLRKHICFKGGYVAFRVYGSNRFTKDVDVLITDISKTDASLKIRYAMEQTLEDGVWFEYHDQSIIKGQTDQGGIRFQYRAGLGSTAPTKLVKAPIVDIDLGWGDAVFPQPREIVLEPLLGSENLSWLVYPIEAMLAEKLHCLIVLGSSSTRAKDVYDIWRFLPNASETDLRKALTSTFSRRQDRAPKKFHEAIRNLDLSLLRRGWQSAAGYINGAPEFNEAIEQIVSFLSEMEI